MKLVHSDYFKKKLKKQISKNPSIKLKVGKQLKILIVNINHPSLKTHKLKGKRAREYSVWIEGNLRITFILVKDTIILTNIVVHDEY